MYLTSLEISGFKSFAKKSDLSFTTAVTGIVGPNGSGKSNVAEAFRFVLGEQSVKSLRGKKTEDLIFNGSTNAPRANRASVRLVFDNKTRWLSLDFDEVSIERVVHRDGGSEYRINGSVVRLKDITEMLATANIGASGHHIISQGEADRVLLANPRERREMIEDALGLRVYQYKKNESIRKLEKTEENKRNVEALMREHAPHVKFLERQMEKLAKARDVREQLVVAYREYLKREEMYLKFQEESLAGQQEEPERELKQLAHELEPLRERIAAAEAARTEQSPVVHLEEALERARTQEHEHTRVLGRVEGRIAFEEAQYAALRAQVEADGAPLPRLEVDRLLGTITKRIERIESAPSLEDIRIETGAIRSSIDEFTQTHQSHDPIQEETHTATIAALHRERAEAEAAIVRAREDRMRTEEQIAQARKELETKKDDSRDAERKMFTILARQQELRATLGSIAAVRATVTRDREEFQREISEAGVLVGRAALGFASYTITDNGNEVSIDTLVGEERSVQLDRRRALEKLKIRLEELGGGSAVDIEKEYAEATERATFLAREIADLTQSADALHTLINDLDRELDRKFTDGIELISRQFEEYFALMFGGGTAGLVVVQEKKRRGKLLDMLGMGAEPEEDDTTDADEGAQGVDISVALPGKKVKGLMMLSGGERALTSIALIFAMSQVHPPPFIILDETDAALDEANSRRYGDMIEMLAKKSQLIVITHNRETMSRAGVLFGVTMGADGASKLLSVRFEEALAVAK
jgi:chromosome segregation protein